jgi:hypothetical protein
VTGLTGLTEQVVGFLGTPEGAKLLRRRLAKAKLPEAYLGDLYTLVYRRVQRAEEQGIEVEVLARWVAHVARWAAIDLVRGRARRREREALAVNEAEAADPTVLRPLADDLGPDDLVAEELDVARFGEAVEQIRISVAQALGDARNPHPAAGALAVLAIVAGDAEPADDFNGPVGGVSQNQAVPWAGVFYGGPDRCFPTSSDPEDDAMRKRRSRALQRQAKLLQAAAVEAGLAEVDRG